MKEGGLYFMSGYFLEWVPQPYAAYLANAWMFGLLLSVASVPIPVPLPLPHPRQGPHALRPGTRGRPVGARRLHRRSLLLRSSRLSHNRGGAESVDPNAFIHDPLWFNDVPVFSHGFVRDLPVQIDFCGTQSVVVLSYIVIFYTGYKIFAKLKESERVMSRPTRLAQAQLTKILLLESTIPLMTCFPITYCIFTTSYNINIPLAGLMMSTMASTIPLVNACSIVLIVPSYRRFAFRLLPRRIRPVVHTEMTTVGSGLGAKTMVARSREVSVVTSNKHAISN
ncbi:hypothetical protein M3Y99_01028000 [Aphelenchoides fujianensis]|nr:hypothetical protein M3Y99_01028000 [Aphelenchoides fujianensis]